MKRREFIKDIAIGSVALTSLPTLLNILPKVASADGEGGQTGFIFVTVSTGVSGPFNGDTVILTGSGRFGDGEVEGGGSFDHFNSDLSMLKASGTWQAEEFVSFTPGDGGVVGTLEGGKLVMKVNLQPTGGSEIPATLTQNCAAFGGSKPEGVILVVGEGESESEFDPPTGSPGSATVFTVVNGQED